MKEFFKIAAKKDAPKTADVFFYDVIGDSWDGTTAKGFAADLKALGDLDVLNIFINSPGGSVFDGVAIFNTLVRHRARKAVVVDGLAASIASIVAMAGDSITMAKNALMMIHDPWGFTMGKAEDFRKAADMLDKIKGTMIETYVDRSKTDAPTIEKWMSAETWLNADETVAAGLADSVSEKEVEIAAILKHDLTRFRNAPKFADKSAASSAAGIGKPHPALVKANAHMLARRK